MKRLKQFIQMIRAWWFYRSHPEYKGMTTLERSIMIDDDPVEMRHRISVREDL